MTLDIAQFNTVPPRFTTGPSDETDIQLSAGPVTRAIAVMRAVEREELHALRQEIAFRIAADIALLEVLDQGQRGAAGFAG